MPHVFKLFIITKKTLSMKITQPTLDEMHYWWQLFHKAWEVKGHIGLRDIDLNVIFHLNLHSSNDQPLRVVNPHVKTYLHFHKIAMVFLQLHFLTK